MCTWPEDTERFCFFLGLALEAVSGFLGAVVLVVVAGEVDSAIYYL
jgi:hypothetical protein